MKQLILASTSPRRRVLMTCMGLDFDVVPSSFDEYLDDDRTPEDVAVELGFGKANAVAEQYPDAYVVGGDLIIVVDGKQLAKPGDEHEARDMLHLLSGRSHQAIGSVVVACKNKQIKDADVAIVTITFDPLPEDVITAYIATGDPYDKAGGYAYMHPLIAQYIHIEGDMQALTGLSTSQLRGLLAKNGIKVPNDEAKVDELFKLASHDDLRVLV